MPSLTAISWDPESAIGRPAVVPVHGKNRHQHGDHQGYGYPAGGQPKQQQKRPDSLGVGRQVGQQCRKRQAEPPVRIAEPFDRLLHPRQLVRARHPEYRHQEQAQGQRPQAIEILQARKQAVAGMVIALCQCIHQAFPCRLGFSDNRNAIKFSAAACPRVALPASIPLMAP